jgi:tetratricopeptide (TPR) repeat protein
MARLPTLDRLLGVLPDVPELAPLRRALLSVSVPDPALTWASANRYVTYDMRVVDRPALAAAVQSARSAALERVERLYDGVDMVLLAAARADDAELVAGLITLGEAAEVAEDAKQAAACYSLAASLGAPLSDRSGLMLALRRLARARVATGDMEEARRLYRASLAQATVMEDTPSRVIALTGMGNALSLQGRWQEAAEHYTVALQHCGEAETRLRAQLHSNLAMVAREQGRVEEAERWLASARAAWSDFTDEDRSRWHNLAGLAALSRGAYEEAASHFGSALALATDDFTAAMVLDNQAELALQRGQYDEAEAVARRAEQHALGAGSPRALAEVYTRLGAICSARMDANGVTFFEKALELAARHEYLLLEATACTAYATFRARLGEPDEARAYEARAQALTARLRVPGP